MIVLGTSSGELARLPLRPCCSETPQVALEVTSVAVLYALKGVVGFMRMSAPAAFARFEVRVDVVDRDVDPAPTSATR
jgi:hypothetical protein